MMAILNVFSKLCDGIADERELYKSKAKVTYSSGASKQKVRKMMPYVVFSKKP